MKKSKQKNDITMQNPSISRSEEYRVFTPEQFAYPIGSDWTNVPDTRFLFMHTHNFLELGYLEKGSGVFNIDDKVIPVSAPCVSIIYPGQPHSAQSSPHNPALWHFLYIDAGSVLVHIDPALVKSLRCSSFRNYRFDNIIPEKKNALLFLSAREVINACALTPAHFRKKVESQLLSTLVLHSETFERTDDSDHFDDVVYSKIAKAVEYINAHFSEPISVRYLAKLCFMSESSLLRAFKSMSGLSPENFIHKVRISIACSRLQDKKERIIDIAYDCGYQSLSSFNRQFIKAFGVSPSKWRTNID